MNERTKQNLRSIKRNLLNLSSDTENDFNRLSSYLKVSLKQKEIILEKMRKEIKSYRINQVVKIITESDFYIK